MDSLKLAVAEVGLKRIYVEVSPDDGLYIICECRRRKLTKPIKYALSDLLQRLHYMRPRVKLIVGKRVIEMRPFGGTRRGKYTNAALNYLGRLNKDFGGALIVVDANAIYIGKLLKEAKRLGVLRGVDIMIISDPRPDSDIAAMSVNMMGKYGKVILITHDKWFVQLRGVRIVLLESKGLNPSTMTELMNKLEPALSGTA